MTECDFCDEFSGGQENVYARRYGPSSRLLIDGPFRVLPTLGQLAEGHLLILPSGHLRALADLSYGRIQQMESLCRQVRLALTNVYGDCIFFEHGIRSKGSGGCGIDHAHMHAVPVQADGVLNLLAKKFNGNRIGSLADVKALTSSYLFFESASTERHVFLVDSSLPSQYMRRLVAETIGKADWDWRRSGREPELRATMHRLLPIFSPLFAAAGE